ncbi:MAG: tRNA pseudouridine(38-40) synthase TruA [Thermodesulfobacteriota bacterium]
MKKNFKITIEYDGTDFYGWQIQPDHKTIQGEIEKALGTMTDSKVDLHGSGRTDAGVHAFNQTANFKCGTKITADTFKRSLNRLLPPEIAIKECIEVPSDFHARFSSKFKNYEYFILNREQKPVMGRQYVWHIWKPLDIEKMKKAASFLKGTHDFKSFEAAGSPRDHTVRTIKDIKVNTPGNGNISVEITADGFLRYMVRNITGTLVQVGSGKIDPDDISFIIKKKDRTAAGMTAPPNGLFLKKVIY